MSKDEILEGLRAHRTLIQEEWATYAEIQAVNELVLEGYAKATRWEWKASHQCECRTISPGLKVMA